MTTRSNKTSKTVAPASAAEISSEAQAPSRVSRRETLRNVLATEQGASIRELCDSFGWPAISEGIVERAAESRNRGDPHPVGNFRGRNPLSRCDRG